MNTLVNATSVYLPQTCLGIATTILVTASTGGPPFTAGASSSVPSRVVAAGSTAAFAPFYFLNAVGVANTISVATP